MVDSVTLQEGQIFTEFQLLVFSVIFYSFTLYFTLKLGQFVQTAVTRGDLFYIFPAFSPIQNLAVTLDYTSP